MDTKKAAPATEAALSNTAINNTTKLRFNDIMHRRMARYLVDGWHTMPELTGGDKCGANPYQYVRAIRAQGIFVVSQKPKGERYGRYKIIHAVSRAKVLDELDGVRP